MAKVRADLRVVYEGQLQQVDAQTFISSLMSLSVLIQEVNRELDPDRKVDLKIVALEPGSFIAGINIHDVQTAVTSLFTNENVQYAASIVTVVGGILSLKKFLGRDQPANVQTEGNSIQITNQKGSVQYFDNRTYNIYSKNQAVSDSVSSSFAALDEDASVTGFEILDSREQKIFEAERDDFGDLSIKSEVIHSDKKDIIVNADLHLHKVMLERGRKWEFYYAGNRISAEIIDDNFFNQIDAGESFAKGDILKVELQINKIFDKGVNTFVIHSYIVRRVIKHVPRSEQLSLGEFETETQTGEAKN